MAPFSSTGALRAISTLPPAAGFPSPRHILDAWIEREPNARLCSLLKARYPSRQLTLHESGKEALYQLFSCLRKQRGVKTIILAAYSCPDIVAAAVEADMHLYLTDIDGRSLEPLLPTDSSITEQSAVVLSNLYGLPDALAPWSECGVLVIDDACQAALSARSKVTLEGPSTTLAERRVGAELGILSFGRGKSFSALGGGAVVTEEHLLSANELPRDQHSISNPGSINTKLQSLCSAVKALGFWCFEHPSLFTFPAKLPGLKIGETHFPSGIQHGGMSLGQVRAALAKLASLDEEEEVRALTKNAEKMHKALQGLPVIEPFLERGFTFDGGVVPIRYPILCESKEATARAYKVLSAEGLGVSRSYGKSLVEFSEIDSLVASGRVSFASVEGAKMVSRCLLTLPVHRYVTSADRARIRTLLEECLR